MSTEDHKAFVISFYDEVINRKNLDVIERLVSEDSVDHTAFPGHPATGPESTKAVFAMFHAAFPDLQITVDEVIAEGDKVVSRATISGTHKGEFLGTPPTNRSFEVLDITTVEIHDGKLTTHWGLTDETAMMQQLGLASEM